MISAAQNKLLYAGKARLQLDDDAFHAILKEQAGVDSAKQLDNAGMNAVLKRFKELGFKNSAHRTARRPVDVDAPATPDQMFLIAEIAFELNITPIGLTKVAARVCKRPVSCRDAMPVLRSRGEAVKVTEALKAMRVKRARMAAATSDADEPLEPVSA
jgi:hypothetical protein